MGEFTSSALDRYDRGEMPSAKRGNGPWGDAIEHWLRVRKMNQADLAKKTKMQAKTISRVVRGFHTQTRVLEEIALQLRVPLSSILVSPTERTATADRRQLARSIFEDAIKRVGDTMDLSPSTSLRWVESLDQLSEERREAFLQLLADSVRDQEREDKGGAQTTPRKGKRHK